MFGSTAEGIGRCWGEGADGETLNLDLCQVHFLICNVGTLLAPNCLTGIQEVMHELGPVWEITDDPGHTTHRQAVGTGFCNLAQAWMLCCPGSVLGLWNCLWLKMGTSPFESTPSQIATSSSILAWKIPWIREFDRLQPWGRESVMTEHVCTYRCMSLIWSVQERNDILALDSGFVASLVVQQLRIHLSMQGTRIWSLDRELRSHMPRRTEPVHHNYSAHTLQQRPSAAIFFFLIKNKRLHKLLLCSETSGFAASTQANAFPFPESACLVSPLYGSSSD